MKTSAKSSAVKPPGHRLALIEECDIRLSPTNAVFIVWRGQIVQPYLSNGFLRIGKKEFQASIPAKAQEKVLAVLRVKLKIRQDNPLDFDEDDMAYTFN